MSLADTKNAILKERIQIAHLEAQILQGKGFCHSPNTTGIPSAFRLIANAPGYET
jgi:hypothetical protein